jgi:hypothetical protein
MIRRTNYLCIILQVINEFYQNQSDQNFKIPRGKVLANMLMNRSFDLRIGQVHMTAFGHGSFRVRATYFNERENSFKVK